MAGDFEIYDDNADWLRHGWTWPPYKSRTFYNRLEKRGMTLDEFKLLQIYQTAVRDAKIIDDEWTGLDIDWSQPWLRAELDLETQIEFRKGHIREELIGVLADAQEEARRALTKYETGRYLLDYIFDHTLDGMGDKQLKLSPSDISGIDGLQKTNQAEAWFSVLQHYSVYLFRHITGGGIALPQIWAKPRARAVYYPKRRLIVTPPLTARSLPQLSHAAAHFIETLDTHGEAIDIQRARMALPDSTLHLIRPGLYALRGPWLDQHDGALREHDLEKLEQWYLDRREFTEGEIRTKFSGRPTEFLAMMAQRVARQDPIEIADAWTRVPDQLLFYMSLSDGNYLEEQP